jgi:hypothetical protein
MGNKWDLISAVVNGRDETAKADVTKYACHLIIR